MKDLGYRAETYITCVEDPCGYRSVPEEFDSPRRKIEYGVDYSEQHGSLIAEIRARLRPQFRDHAQNLLENRRRDSGPI